MKKIKSIILAAVILMAVVLPITACKPAAEPNTKYQISAEYNEEKKQIIASVQVDYKNPGDSILGEVMFHLYPRAYREDASFSPIAVTDKESAYPNGVSYGDLRILKVVRDGQESDIEITGEDEDILRVQGELLPASRTTIAIDFIIDLPNIRHRFGWSDGIVNLGNWYPIVCMLRGGKFDTTPYYSNGDPFNSDIADYEVSLTVPLKYRVATSGKQTDVIQNGKRVIAASINSARDVAAVIGEFSVKNKTVNGVEVSYYYVEDKTPALHLSAAADALTTFGEMFGDYAYETLSVVKTPFLYGGMEYPALVYISDDSGISDSSFTEIIIHEIAHQWWYAAVGNDQIRDAWLDEGLTEYSTTLFYEFNPTYAVTREARMSDALGAYVLYCETYKHNGRDDTSMNRTVAQYANSLEYSFMTYVKGALMLDTLRDSMSDDAFFAGLRQYYARYKFKRATVDDFIGAMESASGVQLKGYFDSWLMGNVKLFAS